MTPRTMRRIYLREAAVKLVLARLAVRFVSPARVFAWAERPPRRIRRFAVDEIDWISWAVDNVGAKPWMNALCLPRALAAHAMLRRRGIVSRVCLGVARDRGALGAHAWVEVGNDKIVGGAEAERFARLATFGGITP
jgi:Transglutaminase-like superfamily